MKKAECGCGCGELLPDKRFCNKIFINRAHHMRYYRRMQAEKEYLKKNPPAPIAPKLPEIAPKLPEIAPKPAPIAPKLPETTQILYSSQSLPPLRKIGVGGVINDKPSFFEVYRWWIMLLVVAICFGVWGTVFVLAIM